MDEWCYITEDGNKIIYFTDKQYNKVFDLMKDLDYCIYNLCDITMDLWANAGAAKRYLLNVSTDTTKIEKVWINIKILNNFIGETSQKLELLNSIKTDIIKLKEEIPDFRELTFSENVKYQLGLIGNHKFNIYDKCDFLISATTKIDNNIILLLDYIKNYIDNFNITIDNINELENKTKISYELCNSSITEILSHK